MLTIKKFLSTIAVGALALTSLTACLGNDEPTNAQELYERYSQTTHDNFNMAGDVKMTGKIQGMTIEVPVSFDFDVNGTHSHGTVSYEFMEVTGEAELYIVGDDTDMSVYANNSASGTLFGQSVEDLNTNGWVVSKTANSTDSDDFKKALESVSEIQEEVLGNAEFAKTEEGYTLTVAGKDLYAAFKKAAEKNGENLDSDLSEYENYIDQIYGGMTITFEFDKDCNLTKVTIPEYTFTIEEEGMTIEITLGCTMTFTKHGKIDEIVVPDDIVNSAVESGSSTI